MKNTTHEFKIASALLLGALNACSPTMLARPDSSVTPDATVPMDTGVNVTCATGQTRCSGVCVDTRSDRENCGGCDVRCAAGQACAWGSCQLSCPSGQNLCGTECATLTSNPSHCGACGRACAAGEVCSVGRCTNTCDTGLTLCSGGDAGVRLCVDTQSDARHCGACGMS